MTSGGFKGLFFSPLRGIFSGMDRKHLILLAAFVLGSLYFSLRILFFGRSVVFDSSLVFRYLILAPLAEELFFRGVVQEWLERRKWPSFLFCFRGEYRSFRAVCRFSSLGERAGTGFSGVFPFRGVRVSVHGIQVSAALRALPFLLQSQCDDSVNITAAVPDFNLIFPLFMLFLFS
ncbi:MAG: CPBP family glutamic-type intramembrane protease [Geovibrio sp.]|nr:CPBP family glutamic-type intramembrane protease [Geovibrio sp.]